MAISTDKISERKAASAAEATPTAHAVKRPTGLLNNRSDAAVQRRLQEKADDSPQVRQLQAYQAMADNRTQPAAQAVVQRASFFTGPEEQQARYNTEKFADFAELEKLAQSLLEKEDKNGVKSLIEALQRDIKPAVNKRSTWAQKNQAGIEKLLAHLTQGGAAPNCPRHRRPKLSRLIWP
ncbi:hypothetical protein [Hymenobacter cellulosivorans]|uniref:Uncharacterized protein n=1 Tax=Hymenobacter cellulosivorans TaxID=2932249 RepID=A0ABY4FFM2_9BACT|nr:hypothetical protein [Hymenobacter cellulosivorans]UOQ55429.1 hypothetical protein MUN80_11880 [Hymenobacter cellulosivorans]